MYALSPGSAFSKGARDLLRGAGAYVIKNSKALRKAEVDLVVTASEKIDFSIFPETVTFVAPHGLGFHKLVPDAEKKKARRLSGLVKDKHLRDCVVRQVVTHSNQLEQLRKVTEHIEGKTELCGDLSFEIIRDSAHRRRAYRDEFGLKRGQKLVVVTSTWGSRSLLRQARELIGRLLNRLPREEYRIALVLHPNVWARKGEGAVMTDLERELAGGALLVRPEQGWHAGIVAADLVIGDHGSVSLYAAMNGTPFLLAAAGDEVVPGTSMAALVEGAPRLRSGDDVLARCRAAMLGEGQLDAQTLLDRTIEQPEGAAARMRELFYGALGLSLPAAPLPRYAAPLPLLCQKPVEASEVRTMLHAQSTVIVKSCASVYFEDRDATEDGWERHLSVPAKGSSLHHRRDASVIIDGEPCPPGEVSERLDELRQHNGNCRIVVVREGPECVAEVLGGKRYRIQAEGEVEPVQQAAVLYALLVGGLPLTGHFAVRLGEAQHKVTITAL
ncbi:hypothetical protein [Actinosynnema mirum]|uniref:hypothetical protein n=1 Tax=Actinosynnema mirum TaxID=40567 RepID=UPI0003252DAD|nr:hypothetical protein [Actinosynnema mirum]